MIALVIALIVSFIPSIAIFLWMANIRKDDADYRKTCWTALFKGITRVGSVLLLSAAFRIVRRLLGLSEKGEIWAELFTAFIIHSLAEETVKYLVARKIIKEREDTVSWLDIMAWQTSIGLGFGLIEDVIYFFGSNVGQILVRGVMAMHGYLGLLMGYYIGKSIKTGNTAYRHTAFLVPFILHGTYDFCLYKGLPEGIGVISLAIAAGMLIWGVIMLVKTAKMKKDPVYMQHIYSRKE